MSIARRLANALMLGEPGFPDISQPYQGWPWPVPEQVLEFPKAATLVPTVYACVSRIANDCASLPPTFYAGKGRKRRPIEAKKGNIAALLECPNPEQSGYEYLRDLEFSLLINGNGYTYLERFGLGPAAPPEELWSLPGHLVRMVMGERRTVMAYIFGLVGRGTAVMPENMMAMHYAHPSWDPLEPSPLGLSPLQAAKMAYEGRYNMGQWQSLFYQRGGNIAHLFNIKEGVAADDKKVKEWQDKMDARFGGLRNAFKPVFLKGVEILRAGLTVQEMQFVESSHLTDADIARVYHIPLSEIGISEGRSLGNSAAATASKSLSYWQNAVLPQLALRDAKMNRVLCPLFGPDITCETDMSSVLPMQEALLAQAEGLAKLAGRPILTVNKALERLKTDPSMDPTADQLVVPTSVVLSSDLLLPRPEPVVPAGKPAEPPAVAAQARLAPRRLRAATRGHARRRAGADLARYERRFLGAVTAMFERQRAAATATLERLARHGGIDIHAVRATLDPDQMGPADEASDAEALQLLFEQQVADRGAAALAEIGQAVDLDMQRAAVVRFLEGRGARLVTQVNETTRRAIREALAGAEASGATYSELVAAVVGAFDAGLGRAQTIARTETVPAYNFASLEAWGQGGIEQKEWLTAHDEAVRSPDNGSDWDHVGADGEVVGMDEPFEATGAPMMYPGGSGYAGNDINCRCTVLPVFAEAESLSSLLSPVAGHAAMNGNGRHAKNRIAHLLAVK